MRLNRLQKDTITLLTQRLFGREAGLWLFGSRVDDHKRGGDFDFYIETHVPDAEALYRKRLQLLQALHDTSAFEGEKIDLVVYNPLLGPRMPIAIVAAREGIPLVTQEGVPSVTGDTMDHQDKGGSGKLEAALEECHLHARLLHRGQAEARASTPFTAETVAKLSDETRRLLDQLAYRFGKLQDSMGEKVLPLLLELAGEPLPEQATFAEKLRRPERLRAIPSADTWKALRRLRNEIAHEYPDMPAIRAIRLNRFIDGIGDLLACWHSANDFYLSEK